MFNAKKSYWFTQILGWGILAALILLASISLPPAEQSRINKEALYKSTGILFVSGIIVSHLMRCVIVRSGWLSLPAGKLILYLVGLNFAGAILMEVVDCVASVLLIENYGSQIAGKFFLEWMLHLLFLCSWSGIYAAVFYVQKSRIQEVNNLQLTASRNEIELKNLRSQLNPHFLFNSLNSIRALVDLDPDQAKYNITTLANLLRKSLVLGREKLISLKEELDLVNDYLELEKVRFEERLQIEIDHDEKLDNLHIPPFVIQTLVENAFKHGISRLVEGGTIRIVTGISGKNILIYVENDGELTGKTETGIGMANTLRRLELLYGPNAKLSLTQNENKVMAAIELTQN